MFVIALGLGAAGGYWYALQQPHMGNITSMETENKEEKPLFYRNPMNPEITSPVPAKDGMGMDYVPVYADKNAKVEEEQLWKYAFTQMTSARSLDEMGARLKRCAPWSRLLLAEAFASI